MRAHQAMQVMERPQLIKAAPTWAIKSFPIQALFRNTFFSAIIELAKIGAFLETDMHVCIQQFI